MGILRTQYLICSRPNWQAIPKIPARMHLRGPRKGIKPSSKGFFPSPFPPPSPHSAAGHPDGKVAEILFSFPVQFGSGLESELIA